MAWQDFLRNNSSGFLNAGVGILSGQTPQQQAALGAQGFSNAMQQNKTMQYLQSAYPEIAQQVQAGLPIDKAWELAIKTKTETPKRSFQTLPDGTYGFADPDSGTFNPLGKAPKQDNNKIVTDINSRREAAAQLGLAENSPAYQSYVLTGKMPREDQAPLTATDKKAILEADEMVLATQSAIPLLDRAMELNSKAYSGVGAGWRGYIAGNVGMDAGEATMELDNVVTSQALGQLKAIFGAAPTEGERKILLDIQGSVGQPAPVRQKIFERAKIAAERRMQFYKQRADELRGGDFYNQNGAANRQNRTSSGIGWSVEP